MHLLGKSIRLLFAPLAARNEVGADECRTGRPRTARRSSTTTAWPRTTTAAIVTATRGAGRVRARARRGGARRPVLEWAAGPGRWTGGGDGRRDAAPSASIPSAAMLERARRRVPRRVSSRKGGDSALRRPAVVGAVLCVYVVHHLDDAARARRGGRTRAGAGRHAERPRASPRTTGGTAGTCYDYFEGCGRRTSRVIRRRRPSRDWMTAAGLRTCGRGRGADHRGGGGAAVFDDPILTRHGTCQLSLLTDARSSRGWRGSAGTAARGHPASFSTDLRIFATVGRKA